MTNVEDKLAVTAATSFIGGLMTSVAGALNEVHEALITVGAPPDTFSALEGFIEPLESLDSAMALWRDDVFGDEESDEPVTDDVTGEVIESEFDSQDVEV